MHSCDDLVLNIELYAQQMTAIIIECPKYYPTEGLLL